MQRDNTPCTCGLCLSLRGILPNGVRNLHRFIKGFAEKERLDPYDDDTQQIVIEGLLKAAKYYNSDLAAGASFSTYAYAVAKSLAEKSRRQDIPVDGEKLALLAERTDGLYPPAEANEQAEQVVRPWLRNYPEDERERAILADLYAMDDAASTQEEIAASHHVSKRDVSELKGRFENDFSETVPIKLLYGSQSCDRETWKAFYGRQRAYPRSYGTAGPTLAELPDITREAIPDVLKGLVDPVYAGGLRPRVKPHNEHRLPGWAVVSESVQCAGCGHGWTSKGTLCLGCKTN